MSNTSQAVTPASLAVVLGLTGLLVAGCNNNPGQHQASTSNTSSTTVSTASPMAGMEHSPGMDMSPGMSMSPGMDMSRSPGHAGEMTMGTKAVDALRNLKGKDFDIAFLSQMIAHHEMAVDMAKQALKVATKPETKEEAQKVIDAQDKEIQQMTTWLKEWHNTSPSKEQQDLVHEDMKHMMSMPVENDHMFFEMMIPHHQGAIDMSELADSRAEKAELKDMAQKIIQDQKAEIEKYKTLM